MTVNEISMDLADLIAIAISNPWTIVGFIVAFLSFAIALALSLCKDVDRALVGIAIVTFFIAGPLAGVSLFYDSQAQQAQTVTAWMSSTYGIDTELAGDKVGSLLAQGSTDQIPINDSGRILNLIVTGDGHLVVVDTGGKEIERVSTTK